METVIVVHGGAGAWDMASIRFAEALTACTAAAAAGQAVLRQGGSALDAVETAVRLLEDAPALDAGRGSYLNAVGDIEMDALIMDGRTLELGAVGAVRCIQNPITLARRVMTNSEHAFLVGPGAEAFAESVGIPRCELADLLAGEELAAYEALRQRSDYQTAEIFTQPGAMGDTVGAVALDQAGNLAAATSTGGTRKSCPAGWATALCQAVVAMPIIGPARSALPVMGRRCCGSWSANGSVILWPLGCQRSGLVKQRCKF
jgi:L-asparaginase / beta-aspartyl-peptidase